MQPTTYTFAAVAKILEIPESKLRYWAQVGFVGPSVRDAGKVLFSFQDLIGVKAAKELVDRGFAVAEIRKALDRVRSSLPHVDRPLDRIRVAFDGDALVVIDGGNAFEVSGQKVFDFGLGDLARRAAVMPSSAIATEANPDAVGSGTDGHARSVTAYDWFAEGLRAEADPARVDDAEACYRKALALDARLGGRAHEPGPDCVWAGRRSGGARGVRGGAGA